jgi:hypothetical protein
MKMKREKNEWESNQGDRFLYKKGYPFTAHTSISFCWFYCSSSSLCPCAYVSNTSCRSDCLKKKVESTDRESGEIEWKCKGKRDGGGNEDGQMDLQQGGDVM